MKTLTSTSKAGLTVTTSVRLIDRTGVDAANAEDRAPLRMLGDEPPKVCRGVWGALLFEAVWRWM